MKLFVVGYDIYLPDNHQFKQGDSVRIQNMISKITVMGEILSIRLKEISIQLKVQENEKIRQGWKKKKLNQWRIDLDFKFVTFDKEKDALLQLTHVRSSILDFIVSS